MAVPGTSGRRSDVVRPIGIVSLAVAVAGALYIVGRAHSPNYAVTLFGQSGLAFPGNAREARLWRG
jgi:hypothetical protein